MMKYPNKDKYLDQLISRAAEGYEHRIIPNFDKWLKEHPDAVHGLKTQGEYVLNKRLPHRKGAGRKPLWVRFPRLTGIGGIAALIVFTASCTISVLMVRKVKNLMYELELARQDATITGTDESTIINVYSREHEDVIARHASLSSSHPEPMELRVSQDDILYYELLDEQLETMHPGLIVRGPSHQGQVKTSQIPAISNGHTLTLSEAREACDFDLVSPSWLFPTYRLDRIRMIEGRDALQLIYTDGINSISLFEQSLDGQAGLSHNDFREYAVYNDTEQEGATILAWRDHARSYVLIGYTELSQLMDMAKSIKATK